MIDPIAQYAETLAQEVDDLRDDPSVDVSSTEAAFTRIVLQELEEAGQFLDAFDLPQEGRVGRSAFRISGYALDEEESSLTLFTTHYTGEVPPRRTPLGELSKVAERAATYVSACLAGLAAKIEPSNTEASDLARRVEGLANGLHRLRIIVLSDAIAGGALPPAITLEKREVELELYDIVRLQRVLGQGQTRADIAVDFVAMTGAGLPCLRVSGGAGQYDAYLAAIPGEILSQVYDRWGVQLLELNVRAFLGVAGRKSVNAELRRTLVESPEMFLAFNNGVVATADEVVLDSDSANPTLLALRGLQIVNGGQTTASLHRARRKESVSLTNVEVPIKIIRVTGGDLEQMVASISRAANRQNPVQAADFSANDPFHQEIEELANNTWLDSGRGRWFYERSRGAYLAAEQKASYRITDTRAFKEQTPKSRRLSKLDMARYLSAWDGLPWRVANGPQKNFHLFMQQRKDRGAAPIDAAWFRRLVAIGLVYRATEKLVKSLRVPAYGANIIAYTVAALAERTGGRINFENIWRDQKLSPQLEALLLAWAPQIDARLRETAGQQNPTEWFKKEDCWKALRANLPLLTDPLPAEISLLGAPGASARPVQDGLSASDYALIERCMQVPAGVWIATAEAGQKAGLIHYRVAGICMTMAGYAAGEWSKRPSVRQAKPALEAVDKVRDAGLVSDEGVG